MYTQLLADAEREWVDVSLGPEFVAYARSCRADLARSGLPRDDPSEVLAAEIRYDGALVWLCASLGITTSTHRFSPPNPERRRLERALAARGIDLTYPSNPLPRP